MHLYKLQNAQKIFRYIPQNVRIFCYLIQICLNKLFIIFSVENIIYNCKYYDTLIGFYIYKQIFIYKTRSQLSLSKQRCEFDLAYTKSYYIPVFRSRSRLRLPWQTAPCVYPILKPKFLN